MSFCASWAEMKSFVENEKPPDEAALNDYLDARRDAAGSVPDGLTDEWDAIVAWDDQIVEVLYSVDFDPDDINETIVAGAFGSVEEADEAEARQQLALDSIDRWSLANCAGSAVDALAFCEMWTEISLNLSGVSSDQNRDPVQRQRDLADWIAQAGSAVPPEIDYEKVKEGYFISEKMLDGSKSAMKILHPLPRVDELSDDVDKTEHALYFEQAANGIPVRMALLCLVMGAIR